ncbi:hypothetical protein ACHGLA_14740 [Streptomyces sp. YH02]|uniref:hypothetical protein n=1 Tax=Streptomyces sp. YH02 TaxID=3256999 RepID=UPI0037580285
MDGCTRAQFAERLRELERHAAFSTRNSLLQGIHNEIRKSQRNGLHPPAPTPQRISDWISGVGLPSAFERIEPLIKVLVTRARARGRQPDTPGLYDVEQWRAWYCSARRRQQRAKAEPEPAHTPASAPAPWTAHHGEAEDVSHDEFVAAFLDDLRTTGSGRAVAEALEDHGLPLQARQFVRGLANSWPAELIALACQSLADPHKGELLRAAARWHTPLSLAELAEHLSEEDVDLRGLLATAVESRDVHELVALLHEFTRREAVTDAWESAMVATAVFRTAAEITILTDRLIGLGDSGAAQWLLRHALIYRPARDAALIMEWVKGQGEQWLLDAAREAVASRDLPPVQDEVGGVEIPALDSPPLCPRCRTRPLEFPARSRLTDERDTDICSPCGDDEHVYESLDMALVPKRQWPVLAVFDWQDASVMARAMKEFNESFPA